MLAERSFAALAAGPPDRKDDRRKASFLIALDGAQPDHLLKVDDYAALPPWRRWGRSKGRRALAIATALVARGLPVPPPVAVGEERHGGLLVRGYELLPWLPDAVDARRARAEIPSAERRRLARALGDLVRRMHETGLDQEDLAPNNFLWRVGRDPELLAIDFERAQLRARVSPATRIRSLAKLDRHLSAESLAMRMRFALAYAGGDRREARRVWRAVERDAAHLLRRDAARWTRTASRPGRRFEPLTIDAGSITWRGWQRRSVALAEIRARLEAPGVSACDRLIVRALGPLAAHHAARAFGLALALHQRDVLPEPAALAHGRDGAYLILAAPTGAASLASRPGREVRASLTGILDRLLAWGGIRDELRSDAFAVAHGRVWLLDPLVLDLRTKPRCERRAAMARARAARLLAGGF